MSLNKKVQKFITANYVLISSLVTSLLIVLQEATSNKETDLKMVGLACFTAILGVFANQWGGKGVSVIGIIGALASAVVQVQSTGTPLDWKGLVLSVSFALLLSVARSLDAYKPQLPPPPPTDPNNPQ